MASATPKGPVTDEAFRVLTGELIAQLRAAPHLDGLLLALHGAMVSESYPDADAEVLRRLREALGAKFPIVVTHDFHANVSEDIVRLSTALLTYKENPHLDTRERGVQAARIMSGIVRHQIDPVEAIVKPPMIYNIVYQNTGQEPLKHIVDESRRLEQNPKILAASVSGGYQFADVPAMGPSVIVVTDHDPELARREAQRLADMLWATRDQLKLDIPDAAAAVRQAMAATKFPVTLIDMGDNVGGGSAADGTFILSELLKQKASGWVVVLADPEAVQVAVRSGVGQPFDGDDGWQGRPVSWRFGEDPGARKIVARRALFRTRSASRRRAGPRPGFDGGDRGGRFHARSAEPAHAHHQTRDAVQHSAIDQLRDSAAAAADTDGQGRHRASSGLRAGFSQPDPGGYARPDGCEPEALHVPSYPAPAFRY